MFKKIFFVLLGITLFTTIDVYAENLNLYFYGNGGKPNTADFYISEEYDFINYKDQVFYASYDTGKTVSKLNSISGKTFTVEKSGDSLVKGREWYFVDGGKVYYFSQSKKYSVDTILTDLGNDKDDFLSLNLYANWSSKPKKGGKDMKGSGGSSSASKETTTEKSTNVKITSISIKDSKTRILVGETLHLGVTYKPSNATKEKITWSTSNKKVMTVDSNGVVRAVGAGSATITAKTVGGKSNKVKIKVENKKENYVIVKYNINGGSLQKPHGSTITLSGQKLLSNKSESVQKVNYGKTLNLCNYNNDTYINITRKNYRAKKGAEWNTKADGSGKSYAQGKDYKSNDLCNASSKDCTVTLYVNWEKTSATSVSVDKKNITLEMGQETTVTATSNSTDGYLWYSSKPAVVKVLKGKVYGLSEGSSVVTVKLKENPKVTQEINVKVTKKQEKTKDKTRDGYFYFLDYGDGSASDSDAILIKSNGRYGLIDTGTKGFNISGQLKELGVKELDFLLISHVHKDHIGGYDEVIKNIPVKKLYIKYKGSQEGKYTDAYKKLITKAKKKNIDVKDVNSNKNFYLGYINFQLYNTEFHNQNGKLMPAKYENANSVVAVATVNGRRVYLAADIGNYEGTNTESDTAWKVGNIDVYKAAHHAYSIFNNHQEALDQLKLEYAIITNKKRFTTDTGVKRIKQSSKTYKKSYYTSNGRVTLKIDSNGRILIDQ